MLSISSRYLLKAHRKRLSTMEEEKLKELALLAAGAQDIETPQLIKIFGVLINVVFTAFIEAASFSSFTIAIFLLSNHVIATFCG